MRQLHNDFQLLVRCRLQVGLPQATDSAKNLATHVPMAGLFGSNDVPSSYDNFHQLKAKDIDGNEVNFGELDGKVSQPGQVFS